MGTGGIGNVIHIDNTYAKTFNVKDDENINLGDFVTVGGTGASKLISADVSDPGKFVNLAFLSIAQAAESANNLNTTDISLRKNTITCLTKGTDWTVIMRGDVLPDSSVGIVQVGASGDVFEVSHVDIDSSAVVGENQVLGTYKHRPSSTKPEISVQGDIGIVSTGQGVV